MNINVVHGYSHMGEKLLRITYNALGVKLTGTIQIFGGCARSKAKSRAVQKNTYMRASHLGASIFVYKTGPFPYSLIGNWYWIVVVDNYSCYYGSFLTKNQLKLSKKMGYFFRKMTSRGTPVKYLCYNNTGEHQ